MNERIKELAMAAELATNEIILSEKVLNTDEDWFAVFKKKFAELIVKECATVQHKRFCEHGDVSWDILMEHFGV